MTLQKSTKIVAKYRQNRNKFSCNLCHTTNTLCEDGWNYIFGKRWLCELKFVQIHGTWVYDKTRVCRASLCRRISRVSLCRNMVETTFRCRSANGVWWRTKNEPPIVWSRLPSIVQNKIIFQLKSSFAKTQCWFEIAPCVKFRWKCT